MVALGMFDMNSYFCCMCWSLLLCISGCVNSVPVSPIRDMLPNNLRRGCEVFESRKWLDRSSEGAVVMVALEQLLEVRELHIEDVKSLLGLPDYIDVGSMTYIQKRMGCEMSVLIMMLDGDSISGVTMCIITDVSDAGGPLEEGDERWIGVGVIP